MTRFRSSLSSWSGYKKNGKRSNGWLVIEDSGDILVKNAFRSDPLGNIKDVVEKSIAGSRVTLKNRFGDDIQLNLGKGDAETFFRMLATDAGTGGGEPSQLADWQTLLQKLADLKNAGLLTDDEFAMKKADILKRL